MNGTFPKIGWIGVGAAGSYYAAKLIRAGFDAHLLLRSDYDTIAKDGLQIRSVDGDFHLPANLLQIYREPAQMPPCDLVVITLKTTANSQLSQLVAPLIGKETAVLTLQNGLGNEELLASLFGAHRVLGGMMFVCISRLSAGVVHHSERGYIRLGEMSGPATDRARAIAQLFVDAGVKCEAIDDLKRGRWQKLVWNIPFNGLGAALDLSTDVLLSTDEGQSLVREIMREVLAVAKADGAELSDDLIEHNIAVTYPMGTYRSSMQIDRQTHRPMEIEAIIGRPVAIACKNGVLIPHISEMYRLLKIIR